ncbi:hypothetical protein FLONG3_4785 [Fusarium longipes]|uniref:Uncharacterized protein n=1 Tax=Fusarium longipes TaxID=694270 RepID=A0A395SXQ8_9HYPO|nr:hypothetical protein FLONG3_4785 [Fusarium longipes]
MKFLTVFSALLASGTALAAYVPQGNTVRGLTADKVELVNRNSVLDGGADAPTNALDSFFDELKHTATETKDKVSSQFEERDALKNLAGGVGNMFDMVGAGSIDFNEKIGHGFNVTAQFIGSVDLNAKATAGIEYLSGKISSNTSIPGASILVGFLAGAKTLLGKFNLNTMAQGVLSVIGRLIVSIDFNAVVSGGLDFFKTVYASFSSST